MNETLEKISYETMRFMRGNYCLDEIGDGTNALKFKDEDKTVMTVYVHEDKFTYLIILGENERKSFEKRKADFSDAINGCYGRAMTLKEGKWLFIDVTTMEQWEEVKKLIQIKKEPNREPFSKDGAVYGQCGQRCDLCIHYVEMDEELRSVIETYLTKMWNTDEWDMRCGGCDSPECYCKDEPCEAKKCANSKGLIACSNCGEHPCIKATVADSRSKIHTEVHYAEEITWGILPYVPWQYESE